MLETTRVITVKFLLDVIRRGTRRLLLIVHPNVFPG
jgi:hypothetical protein